MKKQYISEKERKRLVKELEYLSNEKQKKLSLDLELAIGEGDMRECAAYYVAMDLMILNDVRIKQLKDILKTSQTREKKLNSLNTGSKVTAEINGKEKEFIIASTFAVDPFRNMISLESSIGETLNSMEIDEERIINNTKIKLLKIL